MRPIITVTVNAALDLTCLVHDLQVGVRNSSRSTHRQAGGKGVNVSRVLATLGVPVRSVVVVGGRTGDEIVRDLEASALGPIVVRAGGESRTCIEVIDERSGLATQIHGAGVTADDATARYVAAAVERAADGAGWLALCGSLAPGLSSDFYASLIEMARARGIRTALDASGASLVGGLRAGVDLLRINRDEARALETEDSSWRATARASAGSVVVSNGGGKSIALASDDSEWIVTPPIVAVRNAIGCGDTMMAGLLTRMSGAAPFVEALRFATALATASAESLQIGDDCHDRARWLATSVSIESGTERRRE